MSDFRDYFKDKCRRCQLHHHEEKEVLLRVIEQLDMIFINLSGDLTKELDKASANVLKERE